MMFLRERLSKQRKKFHIEWRFEEDAGTVPFYPDIPLHLILRLVLQTLVTQAGSNRIRLGSKTDD